MTYQFSTPPKVGRMMPGFSPTTVSAKDTQSFDDGVVIGLVTDSTFQAARGTFFREAMGFPVATTHFFRILFPTCLQPGHLCAYSASTVFSGIEQPEIDE